ncbi:MAG: helix-turn-helix transcriptional regulator [Bryobacterales bacterium]|nr:helix-turn-helix transcriptional regulator [Bryobacterales bacterium]
MGFNQLLNRLLHEARLRIRNGQLTESRLARLSGVSQPHMHHILMGKRGLQVAVTDRLLAALALDVSDLVEAVPLSQASQEAADSSTRPLAHAEHTVLAPMLAGLIGAGFPSPTAMHPPKYLPLPRREIPADRALSAARLAHDPTLEPHFLRDDLVVIAMGTLPEPVHPGVLDWPRVIESGGSWRVHIPGAGSHAEGDAPSSLVPGGGAESLVGVIVLTIRRMHSLQLAFPPAAGGK